MPVLPALAAAVLGAMGASPAATPQPANPNLSASAEGLALRSAFTLRGEHGVVAFQDDLVTMFPGGNAPPASVRIPLVGSKKPLRDLALKLAHQPGLCDPGDQVSLSSLRAAWLPEKAKVKRVLERRDVALAVYSLPGPDGRYELWLALFQPLDRQHQAFRLVTTLRLDEGDEYFCGAFFLGHDHVLVLSEEAAGSSDFLLARGFEVVRAEGVDGAPSK
jgi:hypothetical protein